MKGKCFCRPLIILNEPRSTYRKDVKDLLYEQIEENLKLKSENKFLLKIMEDLKKNGLRSSLFSQIHSN